MNRDSAVVETLTAEVRTLVVGNRQITLSVLGQLDTVHPLDIEPMGRVRPRGHASELHAVGKASTGLLVRSWVPITGLPPQRRACWEPAEHADAQPAGLWHPSMGDWDPADPWFCPLCNTNAPWPPSEIREHEQLWSNLPLLVLAGLR